MKKAIKLFLRFLILVGLLFAPIGTNPQVHATDVNPLFGLVSMVKTINPPAKMCVKDTVTVGFMVDSDYPIPYKILARSNGSLFLQTSSIMGGKRLVAVFGEFTAMEAGQDKITIGSDVQGTAFAWDINVIECEYTVTLSAKYEETSSLVGFQVITGGDGTLTASPGYGGEGKYRVTIKAQLEKDYPDMDCQIEGALNGDSTFTISGKRTGDTMRMTFKFAQMQFSKSPELKCKDANDRYGALKIFENLSVDPNRDLWLNDIEFPIEGGQHSFPFGNSGGRGVLIITPREKSK
jgi:hypothetical protein